MKKVLAKQDESSHWYVIPEELGEEWHKQYNRCMETQDEDDYDKFNETFGKYRTGGDLNNVQLFAEIV